MKQGVRVVFIIGYVLSVIGILFYLAFAAVAIVGLVAPHLVQVEVNGEVVDFHLSNSHLSVFLALGLICALLCALNLAFGVVSCVKAQQGSGKIGIHIASLILSVVVQNWFLLGGSIFGLTASDKVRPVVQNVPDAKPPVQDPERWVEE